MNLDELKNYISRSNLKDLFVCPTGKKLDSVMANYGIPAGEEVLALIDATVFGSAKNGLAITSTGIYWHNETTKKSTFTSLTYADLAQKIITAFNDDSVEFLGGGVFDLSRASASGKDVAHFLEGIRNLEQKGRKEFSWQKARHIEDTEPVLNHMEKESSGMNLTDLRMYLSSWKDRGVEISPGEKKLQSVRNNYGVSFGEEVVGLIDCTVFGSAKNGLAITPSGIYWHNDATTTSVFTTLSYAELAVKEFNSGWLCVKFDGGGEFNISGSSMTTKKFMEFLKGLKELARGKQLREILRGETQQTEQGLGGLLKMAGDSLTKFKDAYAREAEKAREEKQGFGNLLKMAGDGVTALKNMYVDVKRQAKYQAALFSAKPLEREEYTFAQANELAARLVREYGALAGAEASQTNDAIVRIAFLLNQIDEKFREADFQDEQLQKILEESSHKNLNIARRLADKNFYVGILGEFSCGKSTFINAMLEERFLIEDVLQGTTCSQTTIKYSANENIKVIFNNDRYITMRSENERGVVEDAEYKREFLRLMTAEEEKARNIREVIWDAPIEVLQNGMCIIDTPGIGSKNPRHTEVARVAAGHCDALLVLTNLDKPLSRELTEEVKAIAGDAAPNCIFIGTRKDQLPAKELNRMRKHFQKRLAGNYGHECQFEFVSAYKALEALEGRGDEADLREFREFRAEIKRILESNRQYIQGRRAAALINEIAMGIVNNFERKVGEFNSRIAEYEQMIVKEDAARWDAWGDAEIAIFKKSGPPVKNAALDAATDIADKIVRSIKSRIDDCENTEELKKYLDGGIKSTIDSYKSDIEGLPKKYILKPLQKAAEECLASYGDKFKREYKKIEEIVELPVLSSSSGVASMRADISISANQSGFSSLHDDIKSEENLKIGGGLATGIAVSMLVPGVGLVFGGVLAFLGGVLGAASLKSVSTRKAEARAKVDESMHDFEKKLRSGMEENYSRIFEGMTCQFPSHIEAQKQEYARTIGEYNKMLATRRTNLGNTLAFIHANMPELKDIAEKMNSQKQKEYFIFNDLEPQRDEAEEDCVFLSI